MSKRLLARGAALGAAAALVGAGLLAVQPAQAAVIGSVSLNPASGGIDSLISGTTTGPCVNPSATRLTARVFGFGFAPTGQVVLSPTAVGFSTTNPMTFAFSNSFRVYATNNASTALVGPYEVRVQCVNNLGTTVYDEYTTTINWTTPGNSFANIDNATYEARPATTTTLTSSVASPATEASLGAGVTTNLTATVDAGAVDPTSGTVQFFRGATSLGTASVGGSSTATLNNVNLPVGSSSLTAVFAATPSFQGSTSSALTFQVNAAPATATTTTLAPITSPVEQGQSVTFDAQVVPNNAVGTVEFFRGATKIGEEPLASGTASFTTNGLPVGTADIKARFVPTNPAVFTTSESAVQSLTVNPPSVAFNEQLINVEVPNGALTISVLGDRSVLLPAVLDADGARYRATGSMDDVRVIDTRPGSPGWTASGVLSQFKQGANDSIYAGNLGWVPSLVSESNDRLEVVPGATVAPADGLAINTAAGSGLSVSRVLATSAAGSSTGTADVDAQLNLIAPTTTAAGVHTAVLTFTAI